MAALQCSNVSLFPIQDQCQFVLDHCHSEGTLDSLRWYYCTSSPLARSWIAIPGFVLLLLTMFMCMGLVASEGLVPNLDALAKWLGLPPSLAGLTLMAFGNGSPDIVSTYEALVTSNAPLAVGELLGSAFFINSVVLGLVFILHPFDIIDHGLLSSDGTAGDQLENSIVVANAKAMYVRDVAFFMLALVVLLASLSDNILTRKEMFLMVGIYAAYVITIVVWQWYMENKLKKLQVTNRIRNMFDDNHPVTIAIDENVELEDSYSFNPMVFKSLELGTMVERLSKERRLRLTLSDMPIFHDTQNGEDVEVTQGDLPVEVELPPPSRISNMIYYVTLPFQQLFKHTIPLVKSTEFDGGFKPGLPRLMQILSSLLLSPLIVEHVFFPQMTWLTKIFVSIPLCCLSYLGYYHLVHTESPHPLAKLSISLIGFITSICWMSILASQVIDTLTLFSILTGLRTSLLGLTVFAIGNSTGDLISCVIIAKIGYPLMSLASCIGGPMLNLLLGLGMSGLVSGETNIPVPMTGSVTFVGVALLFSLGSIFLFTIPFLGWHAQPKLGWFLLVLWGLTIGLVCVVEALLTY